MRPQLLREEDLVQTAKEFRTQIRARAGLRCDWNKASKEMQAWYLLLARRAEGLEEKLQ